VQQAWFGRVECGDRFVGGEGRSGRTAAMVADAGDVVRRLVERDETGERLVRESQPGGVDAFGAQGPLDQAARLVVAYGT
jgi:hypothetical protein